MNLPPLGYLDRARLTQRTRLTVAGYGTQQKTKLVGGGWYHPDLGFRAYAVGGFSSLTPDWLKMSQVASRGEGGACYGDSGGPTFLGSGSQEANVVVAVTTGGDTPCYATNVASRTDTPSARALLSQYVP